MRIIFLNSWYGQAGKPFFGFLDSHSSDTDIFALSEVQLELFSKLEDILQTFNGFYEEGAFDSTMGFNYGQAVFAKKSIDINRLGKIDNPKGFVEEFVPTFSLPFKITCDNKTFHLMNVHGRAFPGHKLDVPPRLKQSEEIIDFLKGKSGAKIIGGDFNLLPQTKSVKMFEESGYRDLIKDYKIKTTRNRLAWEQFPDKTKQYFADYLFVSSKVKVKKFEVPAIEVSDHLPLILDFEI